MGIPALEPHFYLRYSAWDSTGTVPSLWCTPVGAQAEGTAQREDSGEWPDRDGLPLERDDDEC